MDQITTYHFISKHLINKGLTIFQLFLCFNLLYVDHHLNAQAVRARSNTVVLDFGYPELETDDSPAFNDPNNNNTIDVGERVQISFMLRNSGRYTANNVIIRTKIKERIQGLKLPEPYNVGNLAPGNSRFIKLLIEGDSSLASSVAQFTFEIIENDETSEEISYAVNTADVVQTARVQVNSYAFFSDSNRIELDKPFELRLIVQNLGNAIANELNFNIGVPNQILITSYLDTCSIPTLRPGEIQEVAITFMVGPNYLEKKIPIDLNIEDKYGQSYVTRTINATVARN